MDRVNGANWVDIGGGSRGFRDEDVVAGVTGTDVPAVWLNALQENIMGVIERHGLAGDIDDWELLWKALQIARAQSGAYRSAEAFANDPPGAPQAGETWIVGAAPTGAFVGHEHELAEWSGTGWTFVAPTPWMLIGLADRTDWRWDHTLAVPAWVQSASVDNDTITFLAVFPTILAANNVATVTDAGGGQVALAGFKWSWRDFRQLSVGAESFATAANKTYHLRVAYNPATDTQTVALKDLADAGYNPSAWAETSAAFDSTEDDMLIARVVTDGANVPAITPLKNAARMFASGAKNTRHRGASWTALEAAGFRLELVLDWARTPTSTVSAASCDAENDLETMTGFYVYADTRYSLMAFAEGYMTDFSGWSPNPYISGSIEVECWA